MGAPGASSAPDLEPTHRPWHKSCNGPAAAIEGRGWRLRFFERQVAMRPKVWFESDNIWRRLAACEAVARAYGWDPNAIVNFTNEVRAAFSYEEAMAVIERHFDIVRDS